MPEQDAHHRVRDRHGRDRGGEVAGAERDLLQDEPEHAGGRQRVALPVGQHHPHALVEKLDGWLRQRGREPEEDTGHGAVDGRLHLQASVPAEDEQPGADRPEHDDRDRPLVSRSVLLAAGGITEHREQAQPEQDDRGAARLPAADMLVRQEPAERQRKYDRRHEQWLDHREPPAIERPGLERVPDQQRNRPEQPHPLTGEPHQRHRLRQRHTGEVQSALLLKRRRQRKQERRHEREHRGH